MTTLKSKMLEGAALEVVYETDNFYVAMSSDVSAFLILDEIPNYFIYNRQTGKIEGMSGVQLQAKCQIGITHFAPTVKSRWHCMRWS